MITGPEAIMRLRQQVDVRQQDVLDFLQRIVDMDSPTESKEHVDRVGEVLESRLRTLGFDVERIRQAEFGDHLVATKRGEKDKPSVLLVGHFDTVHPLGAASERPFTVRDGLAYGPGVLDMKGGLVVGLTAIQALDEVLPAHGLNLTFVMNSDEEPGSPTSRPLIEKIAQGFDYALVLEPGFPGYSATTGRKGVGIFRLQIQGKAAHAGREPEKGASAVEELARKICDLQALNQPQVGTTVNVGVVAGGTHPYVIPAEASAMVDVRVPTTAEAERILSSLKELESFSYVEGTKTTITGSFHRPPFLCEETSELWVLAQAAGRRAGLPLKWKVSGGASDANNIATQGTTTLDGLGPDGLGAHGTDEHIIVESLFQKCTLNALVLASLSSTDVRAALLAGRGSESGVVGAAAPGKPGEALDPAPD